MNGFLRIPHGWPRPERKGNPKSRRCKAAFQAFRSFRGVVCVTYVLSRVRHKCVKLLTPDEFTISHVIDLRNVLLTNSGKLGGMIGRVPNVYAYPLQVAPRLADAIAESSLRPLHSSRQTAPKLEQRVAGLHQSGLGLHQWRNPCRLGCCYWRTSSTRRLRARPSSVSLLSTGRDAPNPSLASRSGAMLYCATSASLTASARRFERSRL